MLNVMRLITILLIPLLVRAEGLTTAQQHSISVTAWKHRIDQLSDLPYVVRVLTATQACSGVVVRKGYVVTASHCFQAAGGSGVIVFSDGHTTPFTVAYKTIKGSLSDFAILKTDTGGIVPPVLSTIIPSPEELVFHVGHPLGYREQFTTHGIIVRGAPTILIASTTISGESGGPVFDSQRRVFGLMQASYFPPTLSVAVPIAPALKVLSELGGR